MNAERLNAIVKKLKKEMDGRNLLGNLQNLVSGLRAVSQQPNTGNQQNLASYRTSMYQALTSSEIDQFSPAWRQVLAEIGGDDLFGSNLKRKIEDTLAENQMTPTVAADQLDKIRQQMEQFQNALTQAATAFSVFHIPDETLNPGECEIGILIPRAAVHNQLAQFTDELGEIRFLLNTFSEVATKKVDDLEIKTISSSGLMIYLGATPLFAACLAKAIERVVALYKQLLEIRKIQLEIKNLGVPDESTQGIEDYANTHMSKGIEKVSVEIVNEYYQGDSGRKNELVTAVRLSLNGIANRIDNGYNIEVRCEPLTDTNDSEESSRTKAALEAVQAASGNMQFLKLEGKPLLRLPEKVERSSPETEKTKPRLRKLKLPPEGKTPAKGNA